MSWTSFFIIYTVESTVTTFFCFNRATVANLNQKLDGIQLSNVLAKEELEAARKNLEQLQQENSTLRAENSSLSDLHQRHIQVTYAVYNFVKCVHESHYNTFYLFSYDAVCLEFKKWDLSWVVLLELCSLTGV